MSHPARGAWIEIPATGTTVRFTRSHPARGAWIEITKERQAEKSPMGRTPQGVRGLKSHIAAR